MELLLTLPTFFTSERSLMILGCLICHSPIGLSRGPTVESLRLSSALIGLLSPTVGTPPSLLPTSGHSRDHGRTIARFLSPPPLSFRRPPSSVMKLFGPVTLPSLLSFVMLGILRPVHPTLLFTSRTSSHARSRLSSLGVRTSLPSSSSRVIGACSGWTGLTERRKAGL